MDASSRSGDFVALGHAGSEHYVGLETFANPGAVEMTSDELAAVCPVTGQPDLYVATIENRPPEALDLPPDKVKMTLGQQARGGISITAIT